MTILFFGSLGFVLGCRFAVRAEQDKSHYWKTLQMVFRKENI